MFKKASVASSFAGVCWVDRLDGVSGYTINWLASNPQVLAVFAGPGLTWTQTPDQAQHQPLVTRWVTAGTDPGDHGALGSVSCGG